METSPFVIALVFFILAAVICALWWLRYYEKKLTVQEINRRCPQNLTGQVRPNVEVFHIHVAVRIDTPPPTFGRAVKFAKPVSYIDSEEPPPNYSDYLKSKLAVHTVNEKPVYRNPLRPQLPIAETHKESSTKEKVEAKV